MAEQLDPEELTQLTTDIVAAYVTCNPMSPSDLGRLIDLIGDGLRGIGGGPEEPEQPGKPVPAVSVRRSIAPDRLTCLVCGKTQTTLKRHLATAHDLTPAAYREMFELKPDYPMVAPSYSQQRSEMAQRIGLGRPKAPSQPPRRRRRKASVATQDREGEAQG